MVVITGEIQGKGVSSNLRCLYCTMKRSYANVEGVTWFQMRENAYAYTTAIMHFTEYISQNWSALVDYIIVHFPMERKELIHYVREKRLVDSSACLRIVADIFEKFMVEYCDVDKFFIAEMIKEMRNAVAVNAGINESMPV